MVQTMFKQRLIDANALWKEFDMAGLFDEDCNPRHIAQQTVEEAPTVNPYQWISVKDRLPNRYERVLCYFAYEPYSPNVVC